MTLKELYEKRDKIISDMEKMNEEVETRAEPQFTEEEAQTYADLDKQLDGVCASIKRAEKLREKKIEAGQRRAEEGDGENGDGENGEDGSDEETETQERADFEKFIRGTVAGENFRAEGTNMTMSANGAIIPKTIAKKIIDRVENICDIFARTTKYHTKGVLEIPVIDTENGDVVVAYAEEFKGLTSNVNGFKTVKLQGHLFAALALVSKSLINNTDIDVVDIVIARIALGLKRFLEKECLIGTEGMFDGVLSTENIVTAKSATALTADEIIALQGTVPDALQENCVFIMHPKTRDIIRTLKYEDGTYVMNPNLQDAFSGRILAKKVCISDQMPQIGNEGGLPVIFYGDPSGLHCKITEDISLEVLREKYSDYHAIGLQVWAEMDTKIAEPQKLAALKMA